MALSNVRWKGMKAVQEMANTLPDRLAGAKLSRAYTYALKPTVTEMQSNVSSHNRTQALFHSVGATISGRTTINDMYGMAGPRRKKNTWNMQGWHAHIIEGGTKPHTIKAGPGKMMPVFSKSGFTGKFAKSIEHPGSQAFKPFSKGIDSTWTLVAARVSDKVGEIMRDEIRQIWNTYGQVISKNDL